MSTYTQIMYHIVFSTKERQPVLSLEKQRELYQYVWGILKNHHSHMYRIGGVPDHIHILSSLHPTVALADLIKDLKVASSKWIKDEKIFQRFEGWQSGYGAFTHSTADKSRLIQYIMNQGEHHRHVTFREELDKLLKEAGITFDERFLV